MNDGKGLDVRAQRTGGRGTQPNLLLKKKNTLPSIIRERSEAVGGQVANCFSLHGSVGTGSRGK